MTDNHHDAGAQAPDTKTDEQWKQELTPEQYEILRRKGTEIPGTGKYLYEKSDGVYHCAACGNPLFSSDVKFESNSGWPSFSEPALIESVELRSDESFGMRRTEVLCRKCGGHLGHVFDGGPTAGKNSYYCVNSAALKLEKDHS